MSLTPNISTLPAQPRETDSEHHATRADLPLVLHTRVVTGQGGGPEKTILNSPRFLPELGYRSICAYMRGPEDRGFDVLRERAVKWNAELLEIDDRGPLDLNVFRRSLEICRQHEVAIWHAHDYKSNLIGLWVRRYWPMKLVTTVHGWAEHTLRAKLYYAIDRWTLPRYDKVICVSEDLYLAASRCGVPMSRNVFIENAIDTVEFKRQRNTTSAKEAAGFTGERILVGAVGRLSPEKGFDILLDAIARLVHKGQPVDLAIVGEGSHRAVLQDKIIRLNIAKHVRLLGFQSATRHLFEAFDILALSSLHEGLPNVVLEAMSMEVPVVATAVGGVPKVIDDGNSGLLVPPGDASQLAVALTRLVSDISLRQRLAKRGREVIEERYSFARRMQKVAAVYDEVLK